jgi:myo-inositol-1(or 4)-monophosphatase
MYDLAELLSTAEETAVAAGLGAREKWSQGSPVSGKGFRDVVTEADFAAQAVVTDAIQSRFPGHGFLTEEEDSALPTKGDVLWVIDPIDGTINYSRDLPTFCVSVAAIRGGQSQAAALAQPEVLAGAIYDPMRGELFSAARGLGGTILNAHGEKRPLRTSAVSQLDQALLCHDWSHLTAGRQAVLETLTHLHQHVFNIRALGSASLALAWLAAGRVDLYFNYSLKPWDIAAAQLMIREAGGRLTHADGTDLVWDVAGMNCLASNGRLHSAFLVGALREAPFV